MQHIGIEVGDLLRRHRAGMARYTQCLIEGLVAQSHPIDIYGWAPWRRILGRVIGPAEIRLRFFGKNAPAVKPDIFHATACVFPPWKSRIEIATVHDLYGIPRADKMTAELRRRIEYIERADRIICVSHFTRRHLHGLLNIPLDRSIAIPLAPGAHFSPASPERKRRLRARLRLPHEFLLFVGRDRRNKNLHRLVMAYAKSGLQIPLCIAGRHNAESRARLAKRAQRYRCQGTIHWLGPIADEELPVLLSCASALCMPSTFEGFGLPVIEAMACGTPVLTSRNCATEEAAAGHGTLVDPRSVDSIVEGLTHVLNTSESEIIAARRQATRRTWSDVAAETFRVYADSAWNYAEFDAVKPERASG